MGSRVKGQPHGPAEIPVVLLSAPRCVAALMKEHPYLDVMERPCLQLRETIRGVRSLDIEKLTRRFHHVKSMQME